MGRIGAGTGTAALLAADLSAASAGSPGAIGTEDLREWLTCVSSDDLQDRAVFGAGSGLAASYLEERGRAFGPKPARDPGSYH